MKKSIITKIVNVILIIILIIGIIGIFILPRLYDLFKDKGVALFSSHSIYYKLAFYACYIICLVIIYILIKIFNQIYKYTPFKKEVEVALKINAFLFMLLFIIVTIKCIFIPTILSAFVLLICFLVSLSFYVLAEVIKAGIYYKNESDYTI